MCLSPLLKGVVRCHKVSNALGKMEHPADIRHDSSRRLSTNGLSINSRHTMIMNIMGDRQCFTRTWSAAV